jgi:hypothetical protein
MFQWATQKFDQISQTVAPPPDDPTGRFVYAVQRLEEEKAMGCIAEIDPMRTVVNQAKGLFPIHLACQYSMTRLIQLIMNQPGMNIEQPDYAGNTPLHHACMSSQRTLALQVVKMLIHDYGASVLAKNSQGQTPYDVATLDSIRQFLLPIQLQKETQIAIDNGGQGLPPGIDMGGLRIQNPAMPPPPKFGEGMAPPPQGGRAGMMATPGQQRYAATPNFASPQPPAPAQYYPQPVGMAPFTPAAAAAPSFPPPPAIAAVAVSTPVTPVTPASVPAAPRSRGKATSTGSTASSDSGYSRSGGSSAAIFSKYRADGFHSSSSDVNLQRKYGHVSATGPAAVPPPPSSGNAAPHSAGVPSVPGANPFGGGGYLAGSRYPAYGHGAATAAPAPASGPVYSQYAHAAAAAVPTTPYMPPPPYQTQHFAGTAPTTPAPALASVVSTPTATMTVATPETAAAAFATPQPKVTAADAASLFDKPTETTPADATTASNAAELSNGNAAIAPQEDQKDGATADETSSDWTEAIDPSSGKTYYFNSKTNETSWEKPAAVGGDGKADASDWTEATDPSSGKVYYYNAKTGETSWEKPASVVEGETEETEKELKQAEEKTISGLPEGWTEVKDPSSGKVYYYNPQTEETRWEKPEEHGEPATEPTAEQPTEVDKTTTTDDVSAEVIVETKEAEKQEQAETQQTPDAEVSNMADDQVEIEKTVNEDEAVEQPEESVKDPIIVPGAAESTPSDSEEERDAAEEKTQTAEESSSENETKDSVAGEDSKEHFVAMEEEKEQGSDLPEDWVEVPDPSTGKSYYYNSKTQETSWEKPSKPTQQGEPTGEENIEALAEGWVACEDHSTGQCYYYNQQTNETSWEKPVAKPSKTTSNQAAASHDWVETTDPTSGNTYFYNTKTGETSWDRPAAMTADEPATSTPQDQIYSSSEGVLTTAGEASGSHQDAVCSNTAENVQSAGDTMAGGPSEAVTPKPTEDSARPDFISPAAATFGSPETPALSIGSDDAHSFFASPTAAPKSAESAEELFKSPPSDGIPATAVTSETPSGETATETMKSNDVNETNELGDGEMIDVPLSPDPVPAVATLQTGVVESTLSSLDVTASAPADDSAGAIGTPPLKVAQQPRNDTATSVPASAVPLIGGNDLFAAIGMPPPPFQSKR